MEVFTVDLMMSSRLLLLLLHSVTPFLIIWISEIDVFSSHQQSNVKICEKILNTWLKFYLY